MDEKKGHSLSDSTKRLEIKTPAPKEPIPKAKKGRNLYRTLVISLLSAIAIFSLTAAIATLTNSSVKGDTGETGATGSTGETGSVGATGQAGKSILTGEGAPSDSLGNDGDSYVNTVTFNYYVKANGTWVNKGSLKGDNGTAGVAGLNGANWYIDSVDPSSSTKVADCVVGDYFLNSSSAVIFIKTADSWSSMGNLHALAVDDLVTVEFKNEFPDTTISLASGKSLDDMKVQSGDRITPYDSNYFSIPDTDVYSFAGFYTSDGIQWTNVMPVFPDENGKLILTAKWIDKGDYFKLDHNTTYDFYYLTLAKLYPGSTLTVPETYNGHELAYVDLGDETVNKNITMVQGNFTLDLGISISISSTSLKTLYIGGSCTLGGFQDCTNLENVYLYNANDYIGDNAFKGLTNLTRVTIEGNASLNSRAFAGDTKLEDLTLKGGSIDINQNVFNGSFTEVTNPTITMSGITLIQAGAFQDCTTIQKITLEGSNADLYADSFKNCSSLATLSLSGTFRIFAGFTNCPLLTSVVVPSVTRIMSNAFVNCTGLLSIEITKGLSEIESQAFIGCDNLQYLYIPDSLMTLSDYAFAENTDNTSYLSITLLVEGDIPPLDVNVPNGVANIVNNASGCSATMNTHNDKKVLDYVIYGKFNGIYHDCICSFANANYTESSLKSAFISFNNLDGLYTRRCLFGSGFYRGVYSTDFSSSNRSFSFPACVRGAKSGSFTSGFGTTKYYTTSKYNITVSGEESGQDYFEANAFEESDVVLFPESSLPTYCDINAGGDSNGANLITNCNTTLNNISTANSPVYVTDKTTSAAIVVGFNIDSTGSAALDLSCDSATAVQLRAHPFIGESAAGSLTIPTTVNYIGSSFFKGCSSTMTITYAGTSSAFNNLSKADDWWTGLATDKATALTRIHCS